MIGAPGKRIDITDYLRGKPKSEVDASKDTETAVSQSQEADDAKVDGAESTSQAPVQGGPEKGDKELLRFREKLPIWSHRNEIRKALRENDVLIIEAETGSGKSTQVPQFLFTEKWCKKESRHIRTGKRSEDVIVGGVIAITQPRRVAATTLAHRVSKEAGTSLSTSRANGQGLVGYSVRFDHNVPRSAKIKFLTEGMLLQELMRDPSLRQYSAVIVDEIHERSLDVDLLSGFLKQLISGDKAGRGGIPLKVVIMSATANVEKTQSFFSVERAGKIQAPTYLKIPGRLYPVDTIYIPEPVLSLRDALVETISKIHTEQPCPGDILAFLIGQEEIEAAQKIIEEYAATLAKGVPKLQVLPLFGQMSIEAQQKAFQPVKGKLVRKVVLATNIAETSVTVPGVRYVVDCGKAKVRQFRGPLGMESILAKEISKSSAIQRSGRAGREAAGKCYRLYTEATYETLSDRETPEILRIDLLGAVLTMKAHGIEDISSFPLMDTPDDDSLYRAEKQLFFLKAIGLDMSITEMGRRMAQFPVPAPYGRVLFAAADSSNDCLLEVIDIISCLTAGNDIFHHLESEEAREEVEELRKELHRREGDLLTYLTTMQRYTEEHVDRKAWCKRREIDIRVMCLALRIRKQLRALCLKENLLKEAAPADPQPFVPLAPERAEVLLKCFLKAFDTKAAYMDPADGSYKICETKQVVAIHPASVLHGKKVEAFMFLEHVYTTKNYAKKVSAIQLTWVVEAVRG